jgi:arabinofuranan 3-O-arabinosyltransferase
VGAGEGAFSRPAQLLALIALFAGLVGVRERSTPEPAPTPPLPQRARGTSAPIGARGRDISGSAARARPAPTGPADGNDLSPHGEYLSGARGRDISGSAARARPAHTDPHQKDAPQ